MQHPRQHPVACCQWLRSLQRFCCLLVCFNSRILAGSYWLAAAVSPYLTQVECRCMHRWKWEQPLVLKCLMILSACTNKRVVINCWSLWSNYKHGMLLKLLALNLTTGFLLASFFCTASAIAVAASGDCLAMSAISSSRYTALQYDMHMRQLANANDEINRRELQHLLLTWCWVILGCCCFFYLSEPIDCIPTSG